MTCIPKLCLTLFVGQKRFCSVESKSSVVMDIQEEVRLQVEENVLKPILRYMIEYLAPYFLLIVFLLLSQSVGMIYLVFKR